MTILPNNGSRFAPEPHSLPPSMIERVTLIMDSFDRRYSRRTLEQIAQRTGLPRSTTYRILEQLVRLHWLERTTIGYRLGRRALGLGGDFGHNALRAVSAPGLLDLAMRTELVVHLAVLDGPNVYLLDKVGWRSAPQVPSRVGDRLPAPCTALGKAMLARWSPERVDAEFTPGLARRTPRSVGDLGSLHRQLDHVRNSSGLAFERGECFSNIGCVGMAVRGPDGPIGAISVVAGTDTAFERFAPLLAHAVLTVSEQLLGAIRPQRSSPRESDTVAS